MKWLFKKLGMCLYGVKLPIFDHVVHVIKFVCFSTLSKIEVVVVVFICANMKIVCLVCLWIYIDLNTYKEV